MYDLGWLDTMKHEKGAPENIYGQCDPWTQWNTRKGHHRIYMVSMIPEHNESREKGTREYVDSVTPGLI